MSVKPIELVVPIQAILEDCVMCPRCCHANRWNNKKGMCGIGREILISSFSVHHGEEPPISGLRGAGNIFVTGCNLSCVFCQNYPISQMHHGKKYTKEEVVQKMLHLQNKKQVHNIIFVTPSHVVPQIIEILFEAKKKGISIPIGFNSSGYDNVSSLKLLKGLIDIYLPDFKYFNDQLALQYSDAPDYKTIATSAIKEMISQVGPLKIDRRGIAKKGVLIRHLVLPRHMEDSIDILQHIKDSFGSSVPVSLMNQYFPAYQVLQDTKFSDLHSTVTKKEYQAIMRKFRALTLNGYYQEKEW